MDLHFEWEELQVSDSSNPPIPIPIYKHAHTCIKPLGTALTPVQSLILSGRRHLLFVWSPTASDVSCGTSTDPEIMEIMNVRQG